MLEFASLIALCETRKLNYDMNYYIFRIYFLFYLFLFLFFWRLFLFYSFINDKNIKKKIAISKIF